MARIIQKKVSLEKSFKDMDEMERKIFITYVSEHLMYYESHYKEMVELLTKWEHECPIPSTLKFSLQEITQK